MKVGEPIFLHSVSVLHLWEVPGDNACLGTYREMWQRPLISQEDSVCDGRRCVREPSTRRHEKSTQSFLLPVLLFLFKQAPFLSKCSCALKSKFMLLDLQAIPRLQLRVLTSPLCCRNYPGVEHSLSQLHLLRWASLGPVQRPSGGLAESPPTPGTAADTPSSAGRDEMWQDREEGSSE